MNLCNTHKSLIAVLIISFAALSVLALSISPLSVSADIVPVEFEYKVINENEIRINGYTGSSTEVIIPETIDGKSVTTIYELTGDTVTKVTIPKTVKTIYGAAFLTPNLTEVYFDGFSEGFVVVGTRAFPESVTRIVFPANMTDQDVRLKMTLKVFPSGAELYSGTEPLPHDYVHTPCGGGQHYQKCTACDKIKDDSYEYCRGEGDFIIDTEGNNETNHFQMCKCGTVIGKLHVWNDGTVTTEPTEEAEGVRTYTCTVCSRTKTESIAQLEHTHVYGAEWKYDTSEHWHECVCGNRADIALHTENSGETTIQPTETTAGEMAYRCTVCGEVIRTAIIPPTGEEHTHVYGTEWKYDTSGHGHECLCGDKADEALHTPDNGTLTLAPTYDTEGKKEYRCTVCGYMIGEVSVAPLGHNVENEWQSELSGHWQNCECGERHNFGEHISDGGLVKVEPTYETWGEKVYSCTVCEYILRTETILPLSHSTDGEWVSDNDNHWKDGCGCGEKHELSPHNSDTGTVTLYPTASEEGKMEYRCTVCGYVLKTEVLPALGSGTNTPEEPSDPTPPTPSLPSYDNSGNYGGVQSNSFDAVPTNPRKAFKIRLENKITGKNGKAAATRTGENVKVNVGSGNDGYYANVCAMDGKVLYAVEIKSGKAKFKIQPDIDFYIVIDKNSYLEYEDVSSAAGVYERSDDIKKSERTLTVIPQIMQELIKKLRFMLRTVQTYTWYGRPIFAVGSVLRLLR